MKFAFIYKELAASSYPVDVCCDVLGVSRAGYYAWRDRPESARAKRRAELAAKVRAVHEQNRRVYGSPRVCAALVASGERVCVNTVAKVMREQQVRAKAGRKYVPRTTDSRHEQPVAADVLDRQFDSATLPDQKWAADITYVPTDQGWLYLAGVIDLCSRKIVGRSMAGHMRTDLVADALRMAVARRAPAEGLLQSLAVVAVFAVPIVAIIAGVGYKAEQTKSLTTLKRKMIERGKSADEIERVIKAGPPAEK